MADLALDRRVAALNRTGLVDTPPEARFDKLAELCRRLFGVESAAFNLVGDTTQFAKARVGAAAADPCRHLPVEDAFCAVTVRDAHAPLVVRDATTDPRFADNRLVVDGEIRFYAGHPVTAPSGEAIGALCVFDPSPRDVTDEELKLLELVTKWVQRELVAADEMVRTADVQRSFRPHPPTGGPWQIAGACRPAQQVGGDLHDWYGTDQGGMYATVADVMGKGVPAALMMASLRAVLRSGSRSGGLVHAVEMAGTAMAEDFSSTGAFATIWHALLSDDGQTVVYVDAGHGLSVVVRGSGAVWRPDATGLPAGMLPGSTWSTGVVHLADDDVLLVVSDGLTDRYDTLDAAVDAIAAAVRAADGDVERVVEALLCRPAAGEDSDDVTVIAIRPRHRKARP